MRHYHHLTASKRGEIQAMKAAGATLKQIAKFIGVNASTVCRELKRNGGKRSYNAERADQLASQRKQRLHRRRKYKGDLLRLVREYLARDWSPQQIAGYLKKTRNIEFPTKQYIKTYATTRTPEALYICICDTSSNTGAVVL